MINFSTKGKIFIQQWKKIIGMIQWTHPCLELILEEEITFIEETHFLDKCKTLDYYEI